MIRLFAATSNPGKLRDFAIAAKHSGVEIERLPGLGEIAAPPEDEPTFQVGALVVNLLPPGIRPRSSCGELTLRQQ